MKTIAFTGHRPNKLGGYDYNDPANMSLKRRLKTKLIDILEAEPDKSITTYHGLALGWDQMSWDVVYGIKQEHPEYNITIVVAMPLVTQPNAWPEWSDSRATWYHQVYNSDKVIDCATGFTGRNITKDLILWSLPNGSTRVGHPFLNEQLVVEYKGYLMQDRNEVMVGAANFVISCWDGTSGGTGNCVSYAKSKGKSVLNLHPVYLRWEKVS